MMRYVREKKVLIYIHVVGLIFLSAFLLSESLSIVSILLIDIIWIGTCTVILVTSYLQRKKYHEKIEKTLEGLDKKYLLTDIVQFSQSIEDQFYYQIIRVCNKAMLEEIYREKKDRLEYKEYIEQWIHDIKNPLATIKLVCDNNRSDTTTKILIETERINNYMEQVLYYARSANVEKDYLIKEVLLSEVVVQVLVKNKQLLIEHGTHIMMEECTGSVLTDEKWLEFMITQIINNSIQYKSDDAIELKIYTEECDNGVELIISDNGIGILESDIPRVFEKGYTGKNGRKNNRSTGLGLYLCKKLCDKLGVDITIESQSGTGTSVILGFKKGKIQEMQI